MRKDKGVQLPKGGRFYPRSREAAAAPVSAASALPAALAELHFERGEALDELSDRWQEVVGDRAARHSYPTALQGPILEVTTESSAWCQQLQYRSEEILLAARRILGERAPRDLRFTVG